MLDVIHNFIYFPDTSKVKQKLSVVILSIMQPESFRKHKSEHEADGSGKAECILGYWTGKSLRCCLFVFDEEVGKLPVILLITDRTHFDDQLSEQFTNAKNFINEDKILSVESQAHLRKNYKASRAVAVI